jgi:8-oxo-dGTP diphosphatase
MSAVRHSSGYPISVKGVVLQEGRALLLMNERGEWDLPGGRPDPGEDFARTVERETFEESGARVEAAALIEEGPHEVLPGRFVWIVAWGCRPVDLSGLRTSEEHHRFAWFDVDALAGIPLPQTYARAVRLWVDATERRAI